MNDLMIDIETLGTGELPAVLAIGAVAFDIETGKTGAEFNIAIDLKCCMEEGLNVDADTIIWWMQQEDEARKVFWQDERQHLPIALRKFNDYLRRNFEDLDKVKYWTNGPMFDERILRNVFKKMRLDFLLHFRNSRCVRTMRDHSTIKEIDSEEVKHNVLYDCKLQIAQVVDAYNKIKE